MGRYLASGIATKIVIRRDQFSKEEILNQIMENVDLKLYDVYDSDPNWLFLEIKKEVFENNIIELLKEEINYCGKHDIAFIKKAIDDLQNQKKDMLLEYIKTDSEVLYYSDGCLVSNNLGYISDKLRAFCDIIPIVSDGKIDMECYNEIFLYLRRHIVKSLENELKGAMQVSIID